MHFSRLPNELQCEIFYHCLPTNSFARFSRIESPLFLFSVCKNWQAIALSTPKLWSSFEVYLSGALHPQDEQKTLVGVQKWLSLSKAYPLSVKLTCQSISQQPQNTVASTILSLILHQAKRLRHLELSAPRECLDVLLDASPHDFQALTSFSMTTRTCDTSNIMDIQTLGINWSRLTNLYVALDSHQAMNLDSCLVILNDAINLSSCVLDVRAAFDCDAHRSLERISLPTLSQFHLTLHDSNDHEQAGKAALGLASFLDKLDLPLLTSLRMEWLLHSWTGNEVWNDGHSMFMSFMERMSPSLASLHLSYLPMTESHVIDCLSVVPFLNTVDLRFNAGDEVNDPISENLLKGLVYKSFKTTLLPWAHSINIQCNGSKCSHSTVADIIDSRIAVEEIGFKELKMMTYHRLAVETDSLCNWESDGVHVAFDYIHF